MKKICVITGAAGGLGFGCAKIMAEKYKLLISDVNKEKLDQAVSELRDKGYEAEGILVDVSDRSQVKAMAEKAKGMGTIASVIHLAGLTGLYGEPARIFRVNAMGVININEEFYNVLESGSAIMDICSSVAYLMPRDRWPIDLFKLARKEDKEEFFNKMVSFFLDGNPEKPQGMAYTWSRCFIYWYLMDCTFKFGQKGIRLVSTAPGVVETEMSKQDLAKSGSLEARLSYVAMGNRMGTIDEAAFLISTLVDERNSYLTGIIVPLDGGEIASGFKGQRTPRNEADF
ncbi:MAG: SDR family oxidoreductase [Treponema sp.]|jgi:NAD(P)-dependent dehydrogenase (short-subunit alcohol dehydrogenase family)|nr:SDR family oxidoreductase [Treponema sp.]